MDDQIGPKEKLLKAIQAVNLTDLAKKSGKSVGVLSRIKKGLYNPSDSVVSHLLSIIYSGNIKEPYVHINERKIGPNRAVPITEETILDKLDKEEIALKVDLENIERARSIIRKVMRK